MPKYMLDTNAIIHLRQHRSSKMTSRVVTMPVGEAVMSVITYGELRTGAEKSDHREARLTTLEAMTSIVSVVELLPEVGTTYGQIRSHLERRGELIGPNDLWIAAHARASGLTLVTSNEREFRRVPDLQVENWAAAA